MSSNEENTNTTFVIEYIWLDIHKHIRSKIRTIHSSYSKYFSYKHKCNVPEWSYDGSSTGQATTSNSEVVLQPIYVVDHPFLNNKDTLDTMKSISLLALCNTLHCSIHIQDGKEHIERTQTQDNYIQEAIDIFNTKPLLDIDPWFGLEQEFFLFSKQTLKPYKWEYYQTHRDTLDGEFYCGVNRSTHEEHQIMKEFLYTCLSIGLKVSGINQEVECTQWEYQIGPTKGIETAHQMVIAKYILLHICEKYDVYPVFHPKPIKTKDKEWNGSGCHVNISTNKTRNLFNETIIETNTNTTTNTNTKLYGLDEIYRIISNMEKDHTEYIENYSGKNNHLRLTGKNETSNPKVFTHSVGGRDTSIRIPYQTYIDKKGYFEDRRPGSDIDYYKLLCKYAEYLV